MASGILIPSPAPSAAQEKAIHSAVMSQKVRPSVAATPLTVGAPVPPSLELPALPEQANPAFGADDLLKYAIVEGDVVVIDPVIMRVIDVIHGWAKP